MKLNAGGAAILAAKEIAATINSRHAPVDIVKVARELGVASVEPRPMHIDGYLGRSHDGTLVIRYKEGNGRRRNRFTIAHEIGHLLIARCDGRQILEPIGRTWSRRPEEELLANRIAAELLMPEQAVIDALSRRRSSWQTVFAVCGQFDVSTTAFVARIFELRVILAVLFKIDLPARRTGGSASFRCRTTPGIRASFVRRPFDEAREILNAASSGTIHTCRIAIGSREYDLPLPGRRMESGPRQQLWAFGWKMVV